jgi:hypothetical protein
VVRWTIFEIKKLLAPGYWPLVKAGTAKGCDPLPTDRAERETKMKSNAIGPMKKGEKGLRPSGDRPVELGFSFVCNKVLTPGWAM